VWQLKLTPNELNSGGGHYVSPIVLLVIILLATVTSVLWKAAKSNPVEALKYE
jgi:ABC-type lipoprotein release transport system permease subunit